jgi:transcriptional regulator with XRE-family HTH domain
MVNVLEINGETIKRFREENDLSQTDFANMVGSSMRTIQNYESGSKIPESKMEILRNVLSRKSTDVSQLNEGNTKYPEAIRISNFSEMQIMYVPLVSFYAYGGYQNGYGDPEYVENLPKIPFAAEVEHKGDYLCFEVRGSSMDDNTKRSIVEKDILLCRNIRPDLWKSSRLHLHKWQVFVIVHKEDGIMVKEIIKHDVEKGKITVHSYNDMYDDKEIDLRDVAQIFNVVEIRRR